MGLQPDFIGEGNDTRAVALRFAKEVGADRVLFPMAEASLRTIQKALPREQVVEQVVYRTREDVSLVHNNAAILVFTSPSNVRSYLKQARVLAHQTVVAIGPTTAKALKEKGVEEVYVPELPTEEKLAELICSL